MKKYNEGIIVPHRGMNYQLMLEWLEKLHSCSEKIYIYGAGKRGKLLLRWLKAERIKVEAFIDNNVELQGEKVEGLIVIPENIILAHRCKIVISPYDCQEIVNRLICWGSENIDFFVAIKINIPIIYKKIYLNNELFCQIRENVDMFAVEPFPVYVGDKIVDYYKVDPLLLIFDKILDILISETEDNVALYPALSKNGIILKEWDELSEKIIHFFRKNGVPAFFDYELLVSEVYLNVDFVKDNIYMMEEYSSFLCVEQNFFFLAEILNNIEFVKLLPYIEKLKVSGVNIVIARVPEFEELKETSADEKYRNQNNITGFGEFEDQREDQVRHVYGDYYNRWKERKIGNIIQYYVGVIPKLQDTNGEDTNVINGHRATSFQPTQYCNKIHMLGPCIVGGAYVADSDTIPSILQEKINFSYPNTYSVINHGTCGGPRSYFEKIRALDLFDGDYLIIIDTFSSDFMKQYIKMEYVDLLDTFNMRQSEVFFEKPAHMNRLGNYMVAESIYTHVLSHIQPGSKCLIQCGEIEFFYDAYFKEYKLEISKISNKAASELGSHGAIVMNCNPFTLGHLHLIEKARTLVDYLFVFVVEEDKSYFPFDMRFKMVKQACENFINVTVIPSGKIIISSYTMPEYFRKEHLQNREVDPTKDAEIFAKLIAPELRITKRFVGEEPFDTVTWQYNECMKMLFPRYGIELIEFPRLEINGEIVSATTVRKILKQKNIEQVQNLVPQSTYEILREMVE